MRTIKSMTKEYELKALNLVEKVFTDYENKAEGRIVRNLVEEIRAYRYYLPQLELIMVDEEEVIGYAMFSRFHLEGDYENGLLILTPVAVKTELQRQHISKELIEYGFAKAIEMGFQAVLVEGNPANYHSRGFQTSADFGIHPGKTVHLPSIECLMVKELVEGALQHIHGYVEYNDYESMQ